MDPFHILLVEDNEGDVILTRLALEEAGINYRMSVVPDGKEAMDFLNSDQISRDNNIPELILLDINLPKKNGHEVLKFIKEKEDIKHIPVIMLTTSSSQKDIALAYENKANGFITKQSDVNEFGNEVSEAVQVWISKTRR